MADFQIASRNYVDSKVSTKQDSLTTNQLSAVNSGITESKVSQYDNYNTTKQNTLTTTQLNAVNSGITATKVSNYDKLVGGEKINSISLDESKGVITIDYGTN